MEAQKTSRNSRKNRDVEAVKAGQCGSRDIVSSAQEPHKEATDNRHDARNFGSHFRGKERQRIPGKQISTESKRERKKQQKGTTHPGNLARRSVSAQEEHTEHVNEQRRYHQVGGPAVQGANQPPESHLRHDELDTLESRI